MSEDLIFYQRTFQLIWLEYDEYVASDAAAHCGMQRPTEGRRDMPRVILILSIDFQTKIFF